MYYSKLLGKSLKDETFKEDLEYIARLKQGGFIKIVHSGILSYPTLGVKVLKRLNYLIEQELIKLDGQEVMFPFLQKQSLWNQSKRLESIAENSFLFSKNNVDYILAPSSEEVACDLVKMYVNSYKDLPIFLYQTGPKFRSEIIKKNLFKTKEFYMNESYSFHRTDSDLNNFFPKVYAAYKEFFNKIGLPVQIAKAAVGAMGGLKSYEFFVEDPDGIDQFIHCPFCNTIESIATANVKKKEYFEELKNLELYETSYTTMEELVIKEDIPSYKYAKCLFLKNQNGITLAIVRGDSRLSLEKLNVHLDFKINSFEYNIAFEEYPLLNIKNISPINFPYEVNAVFVDKALEGTFNVFLESNIAGHFYKNANFGRDYDGQVVDITEALENDLCLSSNNPVKLIKGIEVGHIFYLGTQYSKNFDLLHNSQKKRYMHMGSYGLGISRLLLVMAKKFSDSEGLLWPKKVTPFGYYIITLGNSPKIEQTAKDIYNYIGPDQALFDDITNISIKKHFKNFKLLGIPYAIVISYDNFIKEDLIELIYRDTGLIEKMRKEELYIKIKELNKDLGYNN